MQLLPLYVLALSLEDLINSQRVNMTCNFLNFLSITAFLQGIAALDLENLRSLGVGDDFYVNDIAVYFNRAFLALPRTVCLNNVTHPTLVEVPWKEVNVILKSRYVTQVCLKIEKEKIVCPNFNSSTKYYNYSESN